jgi:DNA-directed RNA polymerase subunit K/omega
MSDSDEDMFKGPGSDSDDDSETETVLVEEDVDSEIEKEEKEENEDSDEEPEAENIDSDNEEDVEEESNKDNADSDEDSDNEDKIGGAPKNNQIPNDELVGDDDDDDDDGDENYLQKFNSQIRNNYVEEYHPECVIHNYQEISALTKVIRDKNNIIVDPLHRTIPFLTKYEKARVLGQRAKQINSGAKPFVKVPENVFDGAIIAELELTQKRIPFIIRRPFPGGGGCEYWNIKDLELIS